MLSRGEEYRELGSDYFDRQNKPKVVNRLVQRLTRLGFYVNLQEAPAPTLELEREAPPVSAVAPRPNPERIRPRRALLNGDWDVPVSAPVEASRAAIKTTPRTHPPESISMNPP